MISGVIPVPFLQDDVPLVVLATHTNVGATAAPTSVVAEIREVGTSTLLTSASTATELFSGINYLRVWLPTSLKSLGADPASRYMLFVSYIAGGVTFLYDYLLIPSPGPHSSGLGSGPTAYVKDLTNPYGSHDFLTGTWGAHLHEIGLNVVESGASARRVIGTVSPFIYYSSGFDLLHTTAVSSSRSSFAMKTLPGVAIPAFSDNESNLTLFEVRRKTSTNGLIGSDITSAELNSMLDGTALTAPIVTTGTATVGVPYRITVAPGWFPAALNDYQIRGALNYSGGQVQNFYLQAIHGRSGVVGFSVTSSSTESSITVTPSPAPTAIAAGDFEGAALISEDGRTRFITSSTISGTEYTFTLNQRLGTTPAIGDFFWLVSC